MKLSAMVKVLAEAIKILDEVDEFETFSVNTTPRYLGK